MTDGKICTAVISKSSAQVATYVVMHQNTWIVSMKLCSETLTSKPTDLDYPHFMMGSISWMFGPHLKPFGN